MDGAWIASGVRFTPPSDPAVAEWLGAMKQYVPGTVALVEVAPRRVHVDQAGHVLVLHRSFLHVGGGARAVSRVVARVELAQQHVAAVVHRH